MLICILISVAISLVFVNVLRFFVAPDTWLMIVLIFLMFLVFGFSCIAITNVDKITAKNSELTNELTKDPNYVKN